jgi:hypothetical protein
MSKDTITFLQGKDIFKARIKDNIEKLSVAESMNDKIGVSKELWKLLFESAMSYIDPDKRGYDELFKYFDEYVEFEELIFASDSFYRDHTVHCLWVYFLGVYITKTKEYDFLFKNYNEDIEIVKVLREVFHEIGIKEKVKEFDYAIGEFVKTEKYEDSIYCISALTHDLGYPIKKIGKINKSISKVLPYFSIYNYNEFDFQFDSIQKGNIDSFLEILTDSATISLGSKDGKLDGVIEKFIELNNGNMVGINREGVRSLTSSDINTLVSGSEVLVQLKKDRSQYIAFCNDFEEYQHGIMSAFLLTRVLKSFTNSMIVYSSKADIDIYCIDYADVSAKKQILNAITNHTSSSYRIEDIKTSSALLTFIDELEEFSRISRANQSRQYVSEFCKTDIYVEDGVFGIDFLFDNEELDNLDPERAFKGRCKRFLTLFNITELSENMKLRVRCIGKLPYDNNIYTLEIAKKYAKILINEEEKSIPEYLKSRQFYRREEYANL